MKLENLSKNLFDETVERFEKQQHTIKPENVLTEMASQPLGKLTYIQPSQVMKVMEYRHIPNTEIFNDVRTLERTIGTDDLMPINYFLKAIKCGKSVARVTLFSGSGQELGHGTGFMITNNLFMTNNHVFETPVLANNSLVEFNYEVDENKTPKSSVIFRTDTAKFFYTNVSLDFTIVAIAENSIDNAHKIFEFGFLPMIQQTGKIGIGEAVSIIQHPNGNRKSVALRNNKVTFIEGDFIQYETDTQPGSSGSPVFNDAWELVGIHHSGVPKMDINGNWLTKKGAIATNATPEEDIDWIANEGIRISSIIRDLKANVTSQQRILLNEVFANNPDNESPVIPPIIASTNGYYDAVSDKASLDVYYQGIDLTENNLFDSFSNLISQTHKNILSYSPSKFLYPEIDVHPDGKLRSIYSNKEYSPQEFIRLDEEINALRKSKLTELAQSNRVMLLEEFQNEIDALEEQMPYIVNTLYRNHGLENKIR